MKHRMYVANKAMSYQQNRSKMLYRRAIARVAVLAPAGLEKKSREATGAETWVGLKYPTQLCISVLMLELLE